MKSVKLSYLCRNAAAASLLVTSKSEGTADTTKVNIQTDQIYADMQKVKLLWRRKKKKGEKKPLSSSHGQWG
jgi:hypothetical protein